MKRTDFDYVGSIVDDTLRLADTPAIARMIQISGKIWTNCVSYESVSAKTLRNVRAVSIYAENTDSLAEMFSTLREAPRVETIELDVRQLHLALPSIAQMLSLRTLELRGQASGKIVDHCLPQIVRIMSMESKLTIDPDCIPGIEHLQICERSKGSMQKLLAKLPPLESLMLSPYSTEQTVGLDYSKLKYLRLISGRSNDVSPISAFTGVTILDIENLTHLTTIRPIIALSDITDVRIGWCSRISDIELLSELPNLKRLFIYACKFDLEPLRKLLEGKLEDLRI